MIFKKTAKQIGEKIKNVPKSWDGRDSIIEMKESGYSQWKQMEWIGFYFQFLCERYLSDFMKIPGSRYGNVSFDA